MLSTIFTDIASGLTSFIPAFFGAILLAFQILFMNPTTVDGVTTYSGLSPIGEIAIVFITMGIAYKVLPTVVGWLRLRVRAYKRARRAKAKA